MYVKLYEFSSFTKNIGKNLSNKYSQKILDSPKKSTTDAIKTVSKKQFKKQEKQLVIWLLIKLVIISSQNVLKTDKNELEIPKERHISPEKRKQTIDELRLLW